MIDISLDKNRNLYEDYELGLKLLDSLDENCYEYPNYKVNFHLYSEVVTDKELVAVKSFFATQNLEKTKLILWSDYDITNNKRLQPYKTQIDFRVLDPIELAKRTPMEGNSKQLLAKDSKHYMMSGMLRFLAPYKMNGVWFDMDMILLRDLKPILDQEFAYQWGSEIDFLGFGPCAAFMNIFQESEHAKLCLNKLQNNVIVPNSVCRDHQMLAKVYAERKFTIFPSTFFNTEWLINKKYKGLGTTIESGWFKKNEFSKNLFLEAFAWHWHNGGGRQKHVIPEPGSKFDLIEHFLDKKLKEKGIL